MEQERSQAEVVLRAHVESGAFRIGVANRRWRLVAIAWPHAIMTVRAADSIEYGLRFECTDYPRTPATARPWDVELDAPLAIEKWPTGCTRVPAAFNPDWNQGTCLYLPCDRLSIQGHSNWVQEHPSLLWSPSLGVILYLRVVHELLNSGDYSGCRAT